MKKHLKGMYSFSQSSEVKLLAKEKGCRWTYSNESIAVQAVTGRRQAHELSQGKSLRTPTEWSQSKVCYCGGI